MQHTLGKIDFTTPAPPIATKRLRHRLPAHKQLQISAFPTLYVITWTGWDRSESGAYALVLTFASDPFARTFSQWPYAVGGHFVQGLTLVDILWTRSRPRANSFLHSLSTSIKVRLPCLARLSTIFVETCGVENTPLSARRIKE